MSNLVKSNTEYESIQKEIQQGPSTRKEYYLALEELFKKPVLSFFTSFVHPIQIEDEDVVIFEDFLQPINLKKAFILLINSAGGDGEAAERIANMCRRYSKENYITVVLGRAKSAATLICFGSEKILMSESAELGPVDPQIFVPLKEGFQRYSAYNLVNSFNETFEAAVNEDGNLEPYIQQLTKFSIYDIQKFQSWIDLSEDIAVKLLESGMMKGIEASTIRKRIKMFLNPEEKKVHSRAIYAEDCQKCGLNIEIIDRINKLECWSNLYKLYSRLHNLTNRMEVGKVIEDKERCFALEV
ncbi:MAG: hypothetical protein GF317_00125 [Candidatus Lokiarchaeota archaeon]|nr:hypothetical protein [Candidatus Lokiarchaeota archaeon]MBD3198389.1 hypothetical protein [Candidatus Lokiarchaeota archaeon]